MITRELLEDAMPYSVGSIRPRDPRPTATQRGYDAAWRRLRLAVLRKEPLCRMCRAMGRVTPAEDVDHIETVVDRPDLRLAVNNLRPLCKSCHSRRTRADQRG